MRIVLSILFVIEILSASSAKTLFYGNCTACHELRKANSAPSVAEFKDAYKKAFPRKKEFIHYMSTWVYAPSAKTSIMHLSVEKYGLMPNLGYDKAMLELIAGYIYDSTF